MKCSICKKQIEVDPISGWDQGNNAQPVNDGRCCDSCNAGIVIPMRLSGVYKRFVCDNLKAINKLNK